MFDRSKRVEEQWIVPILDMDFPARRVVAIEVRYVHAIQGVQIKPMPICYRQQ
jgi:hypothetical protein